MVGLLGIVGILLDAGGHLLHRGGGFLGGGGLFGGALGELLGGGAQFLAARGDPGGRQSNFTDNLTQVLDHLPQREPEGVFFREERDLDGQVPLRDSLRDAGRRLEILNHPVEGLNHEANLVP